MTNSKRITSLFLISILLTSCASTYLPINAEKYVHAESFDKQVTFDYSYDVFDLSDNKNYTKRSIRDEVQVVAVQVNNQSDKTITIFEDYVLSSNNRDLELLEPVETYKLVKRNQGVFFYWLVMGLVSISISSAGVEVGLPIGLVTGVILAVYNLTKAGKSNLRLLENLVDSDLRGKVVLPGQKVSGLIAFRSLNQEDLEFEAK